MPAEPPAALVQRAPGGVETERADPRAQVRDERDRIAGFWIVPRPGSALNRGRDGCLDRLFAESARFAVGENGGDRKGISSNDELRPGNAGRGEKELSSAARRQLRDDALDAARGPQPEVRSIPGLEPGLEGH